MYIFKKLTWPIIWPINLLHLWPGSLCQMFNWYWGGEIFTTKGAEGIGPFQLTPSHSTKSLMLGCNLHSVELPKQSNSHQSILTFLCFGSLIAQVAPQQVWFCTMWPGHAKGLFEQVASRSRWSITESIKSLKDFVVFEGKYKVSLVKV